MSEMTKVSELHDRDFFLWTQEQAAALRAVRKSNLPLDWDNLAEEIESLGTSQRTELNSQVRRILRHLFKLGASPAADPRAEDLLEASPSLRREIDAVVKSQGTSAAKLAAYDLEDHGEPVEAVWARLEKGGFTAEQVLDDWLPNVSS